MRRLAVALAGLSLTALLLSAPAALAGDPCPIGHQFHDVGPPEWLDRAELLGALKSKDSWVGISFRNHDGAVQVSRVAAGSPAASAGLKKGDRITAGDGTAVSDHKALAAMFRAKQPGEVMALTLEREAGPAEVKLTLGAQDPVVGALIDEASSRDCTDASRANVDAARAAEIRAAVFSKARRFRCKDAHRALAKAGLYGGDIVIVRGSKRILVSNPEWATTCVNAADYDGPKLNKKTIGKLLDKVARRYVKDRHDNP